MALDLQIYFDENNLLYVSKGYRHIFITEESISLNSWTNILV